MLDVKNKTKTKLEMEIPRETYSIGLYEGNSPFDLKPSHNCQNPILSRKNFEMGNVNFVADPFAVFHNDIWYLFYEKMDVDTRKGKICVSTGKDRYSWSKGEIVLEESFHLSYPQIFKHDSYFYMIPESYESNEVRLYKATKFPFEWEFEKILLEKPCVDSTILLKDNIWWLFACDTPHDHNRLRLYYSDALYGEWKEHVQSPIYENDNRNSRPAGKLLQYKNKTYRFSQDCGPFYGHSVRAFEIETLNLFRYEEKELKTNPILYGGNESWNGVSMHHMDIHMVGENHWIAFVDGRVH